MPIQRETVSGYKGKIIDLPEQWTWIPKILGAHENGKMKHEINFGWVWMKLEMFCSDCQKYKNENINMDLNRGISTIGTLG